MMSGEQLRQWVVYARDNAVDADHASTSPTRPYYLGWSLRGYRRLCLRWWVARQDDYRQQIATAKQMIREAKGKPRGEPVPRMRRRPEH
jgi:S-DNA-T family DNA segregation ATPase FtsK/SpoIIIE